MKKSKYIVESCKFTDNDKTYHLLIVDKKYSNKLVKGNHCICLHIDNIDEEDKNIYDFGELDSNGFYHIFTSMFIDEMKNLNEFGEDELNLLLSPEFIKSLNNKYDLIIVNNKF